MAEVINLEIGRGGYGIVIEPGLLEHLSKNVQNYGLRGKVAVVTSETVAPLYGESVAAALPQATLITMPDGEHHKTPESVARLCGQFAEIGLDRVSTIVALGGGVVGDTAGFAAATYMRGISLVHIPTTLLAMIDSSIGGKVGVDLPQGKNMMGAFKQPDIVLVDPDVLKTLPEREWRCGTAVILKYGLLADEDLLNPVLHIQSDPIDLIRRAIKVKVSIVEHDPHEKGARMHLNLGHTFSHAIELVSDYEWSYGEALGFGMLAAVKLSHHLELCDESLPRLVNSVLAASDLPRRLRGLDPEAVYAAMSSDKKWINDRSRFVLLKDIGQPVIMENVPKESIIHVLEDLA